MSLTRQQRTNMFSTYINNKWNEQVIDFITRNSSRLDWNILSSNKLITMDIIETTLHLPWVWDSVSTNPNININMIRMHPEIYWNWDYLTVTWTNFDDIEKNGLDLPWDWNAFSTNRKITAKFINNHLDINWDWSRLSLYNINFNFIIKHLDKPWNYYYLSNNTTIKLVHIKEILKKTDINELNWSALSKNPSITLKMIEETIDTYPWEWEFIATNRNLNIEFIKKYMDKFTSQAWFHISSNSSITLNMIKENPNLHWDKMGLLYNYNITSDFIMYNGFIDFIDVLPYLQHIHDININILTSFSELNFNSDVISNSRYIYMEDVENNILNWSWESLSNNINLTFDIINKNLDKQWNFISISYNSFQEYKKKFFEKFYREYMACYKIQQYYYRALTDINYKLCHIKLNHDYDEFINA